MHQELASEHNLRPALRKAGRNSHAKVQIFCDLALHKARPRPMAFRLTSGDKYNFQDLLGHHFFIIWCLVEDTGCLGVLPSNVLCFRTFLDGWGLEIKALSGQLFMLRLGNGSRSGNSPKVKKSKSSELSPPIVENDATSGESILHTFLASQLPYNTKIWDLVIEQIGFFVIWSDCDLIWFDDLSHRNWFPKSLQISKKWSDLILIWSDLWFDLICDLIWSEFATFVI